MMALSSDKNLCKLLENTRILSVVNRDTTIDIFYDAVKLIYYKQNHMKKNQLKPKEIARCLNLIYYHHLWSKTVNVSGILAENMGKDFPEEDALKYYQHKVMGKICRFTIHPGNIAYKFRQNITYYCIIGIKRVVLHNCIKICHNVRWFLRCGWQCSVKMYTCGSKDF